MKQRVSRRTWYSPPSTGSRPRVLIEDSHPALEISDFTAFRDAGFDVAYCSGPAAGEAGGEAAGRGSCPLLCGADCEVLADADVVLHGLDPAAGVAADIRWWHPELPVVVKTDDAAPAGLHAHPGLLLGQRPGRGGAPRPPSAIGAASIVMTTSPDSR